MSVNAQVHIFTENKKVGRGNFTIFTKNDLENISNNGGSILVRTPEKDKNLFLYSENKEEEISSLRKEIESLKNELKQFHEMDNKKE